MHILTIESCTETSTLGLVRDDGTVLAEAAFPSRHTLAKRLFVRLEWLLDECGLTKNDIAMIALSLGPGSFTGVRIGAAAAKTLAMLLNIPLFGVPTLEALAYPLRHFSDALLVPIINARRQQAYVSLFRGEGGALLRVTADLLLSAEPFHDLLRQHLAEPAHLALIGQVEGLPPAFMADAPAKVFPLRSLVTPHALAMLGLERLQRGETDDPMTLTPIYLRSAAD
jgi:tRNA threonylcarbamoyladenosine biosynthesis protein TsaB